jgi:hypothetical protein
MMGNIVIEQSKEAYYSFVGAVIDTDCQAVSMLVMRSGLWELRDVTLGE